MADEPQALTSRRVLVVDDQSTIWQLLETGLSDVGAEVWALEHGLAISSLGSGRERLSGQALAADLDGVEQGGAEVL